MSLRTAHWKPEMWMKWYPADYLRDTRHLSCLEHGAYRQLIDAVFCAGGVLSVTDEDLPRLLSVSVAEWAQICTRVRAFFSIKSGENSSEPSLWRHNRVTEEIRKAKHSNDLQRKRTEAAREALARKRQPVTVSVTDIVTETVTTSKTETETETETEVLRVPPNPPISSNGRPLSKPLRESFNLIETMTQLLDEVGAVFFERPPKQFASDSEQRAALSVFDRPDWRNEKALILAFGRRLLRKHRRYQGLPSLSRLLEEWAETLDKARNYDPSPPTDNHQSNYESRRGKAPVDHSKYKSF